MKPQIRTRSRLHSIRILAAITALSSCTTLTAAEILKANNADPLEIGTSWSTGTIPTAMDIAVFDSSFVPPPGGLIQLNTNLSVQGIKVIGAASGIIVDSFFSSPKAVLSVGSSGLDFSAASPGSIFSFDDPTIRIDATQTWSVADGVTVNLNGTISRAAGSFLKTSYGPLATGAFVSTNIAASSLLPYGVTADGADFLAVDASNRITPALSAAVYTNNPATGAALPNMSGTLRGIDVISSNTGSPTAFRLSNTLTVNNGGIRFGTAHTTGADWTVDLASSRVLNIANGSILVTPAVGASAVSFNGSGTLRLGAGSSLSILQNNSNGDLFVTASITEPANAGASLVKTGPGKLVLSNNGNNFSGQTLIQEGTVQIGGGGATGDIADASLVINNGVLAFNRTGTLAFPNVISGAGSVAQLGPGEIQITGSNTFTGPVSLAAGTLTFSNAANLGAGTTLNFSGGTLRWSAGNTSDLSSTHSLAFGAGGAGIDTNGQDVTFTGSIGAGGSGGLRKLGLGRLTLQASSTFQGASTVEAGTLALVNSSGSALGSGSLSVSSGATLTGTGSASGTASFGNNASLNPGLNGVGTLSLGGLTLNAGSVLNLEFGGGSNDQIITTLGNGLTINGGGVNLYTSGSTAPLTTPGTYNLVQYSGNIAGTGASALSVLNTQPGYAYTFGTNSGFLTLQVVLDSILSQWTATGAGSWASPGNWSNGVATSGYTAQFTTSLGAPATVTLDGSRTVNGLVFSSVQPYTLAAGTGGSLTLSKSSGSVLTSVSGGAHVISAPVALSSGMTAATEAGASLTLSGLVSGPSGIVKTGPGLLSLTAANTFAGAVSINGGTLAFGLPSSLGTGSITINGGTLQYLPGNTADISSRSLTFGQNGATLDTNGNDVIWMSPFGGAGGLTKTGNGILALDAVNTFGGGLTVTRGTVRISSDASLGTEGVAVTLNGGALNAASMTLATNSTNRPVVLGEIGGTLNVDSGATLVLASTPTGTGSLTKTGAGILNLPTGSLRTGGTVLSEGVLHLAADSNFVNSTAFLGTGSLTLDGGTLSSAHTADNTLTIGNTIVVPSGKSATITAPNRVSFQGAFSGTGTVNIEARSDVARTDFANSFTGMSGQINFRNLRAGGLATTVRLLCNNSPAFNAASFGTSSVDLAPGVSLATRTNSTGNTIAIGSLTGAAGSSLTTETVAGGGRATYQIGALGLNTTFAGNLADGPQGIHLTKVGVGTLTLTGESNTVGNYNVNAGTLLLDGAHATVANTTVAIDAALGGIGTLGGAVTVNGTLSPDPTGTKGGNLTLTGNVTLSGTSRFDIRGKTHTGINSTSGSALNLGGSLRVAFAGSVFNGTYQLFTSTGGLAGNFTGGVSATSGTTTTPVALLDSSGSWTGSLDGATLEFNSITGLLTVTNGLEAITPGTTSSLVATGGISVVNLTWSSVVGADTYTVKRATSAVGPFIEIGTGIVGTAYSDTAVTNNTTYYYVIAGKNTISGLVGTDSNVASATPTAVVFTSLQNWRFANFGVYDDTVGVLAGDSEDFDGDGTSNLLEYALATNPTIPNLVPVTIARNGNFLTLSYPVRTPADPALNYLVEGTSDLGTTPFSPAGGSSIAGSTVTYTDNVNLSLNPRRFLRLQVTYTAP